MIADRFAAFGKISYLSKRMQENYWRFSMPDHSRVLFRSNMSFKWANCSLTVCSRFSILSLLSLCLSQPQRRSYSFAASIQVDILITILGLVLSFEKVFQRWTIFLFVISWWNIFPTFWIFCNACKQSTVVDWST